MDSTQDESIPFAGRPDTDPGDEVQRNFRYQHAYGVILLLAAARGELAYTSLWCEHHEDFIAARADGRYDAYQVKTAQPENGPWRWNADGLRKSVKRFAQLQTDRPGEIYGFRFVSNVRCLDSHGVQELKSSPPRLLERIRSGRLDGVYAEAFSALRDYCECKEEDLRYVLSRLNLVVGPTRESFHDEIVQRHLAVTSECRTMTVAQLQACLDVLIDVITRASSLRTVDASKHWWPTTTADAMQPYMRGKRVAVGTINELLAELAGAPFRYVPGPAQLRLGGTGVASTLETKLTRGGLAEYTDIVRARAISAERHLMELVSRASGDTTVLNQIEAIVNGECQEARLDASAHGGVYGPQMLRDVHRRLRAVAESRPAMVYRQEYELLVGVAGLLTEDCRVWWSEVFEVGKSA